MAGQSARRESNPRSGPYKRPALTVELRAASGAGGIRTLTLPLKRRMRCRYATAPRGAGVCVSAAVVPTSFVLQVQVVRGGVEPTACDVSDRLASVTTPDRIQVGMVGVEPTRSCSQGTRAAVTLHPVVFEIRTAGLEPRPSLRDGAKFPLLAPDLAEWPLSYALSQVARRGFEPLSPA